MGRNFIDVIDKLIDIAEPEKEDYKGLYEELKVLRESIFLILPETEIDYWHKLQNIINYYFHDVDSYDGLPEWQVKFVKVVKGEDNG
jgi:hypothetical protein